MGQQGQLEISRGTHEWKSQNWKSDLRRGVSGHEETLQYAVNKKKALKNISSKLSNLRLSQ